MAPRPIITPWILTASTNYKSDGKLFIGQVLADPMDPASALISGKPRALPPSIDLEETTARNPTLASHDLLQHSGGFWLESRGGVASVSAEGASRDDSQSSWEVKNMVGKLTTFSLKYVTDTVLEERDIKDHVKSRLNPFPPTLYIITGVRIFVDAKLVSKTAASVTNFEGQAAIDGTQHQVPVRAGFKGQSTHAQTSRESFDTTTDFVFAYMCNKVNYFPWKRMNPYTAGQTASSGRGASEGGQEEILELRVGDHCDAVEGAGFGAGDEADDVAHRAYTLPCSSVGDGAEVEVRYFWSC